MQNNMHIVLNSFTHGSRILKETASLVESGIVDHVYIAALYEDGVMEYEDIDPARSIRRFSLISRRWSNTYAVQVVKYIEFCLRVIHYARSISVTLVNIHLVDLLPLGVLLKWLCNAKLIYDAHELETETYGQSGFRQKIAQYIERTFIHRADLVIVVSDSIEQWYRTQYGLSNIVTALNCPVYQESARTHRLHDALGIPSEKKIVIYQGGLIQGRGIEKLLRVFDEHDDQKHVLVCMGYGELSNLIQEYVNRCDNIFLQPAVAPNVVLQYTASADIGVSYIDNPSLNDRYCLPNKLFEYIMAGLPVIVNNAPEQKRLVTENQIGVVLDELTVESLANALNGIEQMDGPQLTERLKQTAKQCSWGNQAKLMIDAYHEHAFVGQKI